MEPNSCMILISKEGKVIKFFLKEKSTITHNLNFEKYKFIFFKRHGEFLVILIYKKSHTGAFSEG